MKLTKLYDANVYVNDSSVHGQAAEVTCPDIAAVMTDYKSLGMVGSAEFFNGFDKMEATIKWTYPDTNVQKTLANFLKPVNLMVRSSKAEYDGGGIKEEVPVVIYLRGYSKKHPGGSFKQKEDTEVESTFSISYFKQEIDGEAIVELDVLNNIYKVGGEDLLAERRQNLGI
ncbi:MAG: phage major tail tube protein [Prevotellaceae bacterium]|jgi:P2 family phage contractile tail tube protein|nr:phage major tail tube protein [Prevotellaceae bacterium]